MFRVYGRGITTSDRGPQSVFGDPGFPYLKLEIRDLKAKTAWQDSGLNVYARELEYHINNPRDYGIARNLGWRLRD